VVASFPPNSRCNPATAAIGVTGAKQIYGEKELKNNITLKDKTYAQAEKEKPMPASKYYSLDKMRKTIS
jgi:hypothetical protein